MTAKLPIELQRIVDNHQGSPIVFEHPVTHKVYALVEQTTHQRAMKGLQNRKLWQLFRQVLMIWKQGEECRLKKRTDSYAKNLGFQKSNEETSNCIDKLLYPNSMLAPCPVLWQSALPMSKEKPSARDCSEQHDVAEQIERLNDELLIIRNVMDELLDVIQWITRNGIPPADVPQHILLKKMALNPCAADWSERLEIVQGDSAVSNTEIEPEPNSSQSKPTSGQLF